MLVQTYVIKKFREYKYLGINKTTDLLCVFKNNRRIVALKGRLVSLRIEVSEN